MPESPVSGTFTEAPPGKKALTADELKTMMDATMQKAAAAIGGTVVGLEDPPEVKQIKNAPLSPVDEEDKRRYIRSLLAKEKFSKIYTLFGGALEVGFQTRTVADNEKILDLPENKRYQARLLASLFGLQIGKNSAKSPTTIARAPEIVTTELDDVAFSAISQVFREFEDLCDELFRRANDPDFWTGTAGPT